MPNALELTGIRKSFDGFAALTDAHFAARWGEVHALLGENGAGKSSLMNIAAGLYAPEAGQLLVDDNAVRFAGPRDAAKHRIGMVHQHFKLVRPFTVAQNILLTAPPSAEFQSHGERLREITRDIRNKAAELGFDIDPSKRVDALSIAEQQRVEILKVLLAGARILILDEPTAVLTDQEAARLLQTVQGLARTSSPRLGLCASTSVGDLPNSRASTSFCALPPESSAAFCATERTPCTSKARTASCVSLWMRLRRRRHTGP